MKDFDFEPILKLLSRFARRRPMVGVDQGSGTYKFLAVKALTKPYEISHALSFPGGDAVSAAKIKDTFKVLGNTDRSAAMSIPDEKIEWHHFKSPKIPKSELDATIRWELKKKVSSIDNIFFDVVVDEKSDGNRVSCVVAPKDTVKKYYQTALEEGLDPCYLETESTSLLACAKALNNNKPLKNSAILDLGLSSFRIIFIHDDQVSFVRALPFGLLTFYQRVASQWNFPPEKVMKFCQELKEGSGQEKPSSAHVATQRMLHECLNMLLEEFRSSEIFVKDNKRLGDIEDIYLCGGGACIGAVVRYLKHCFAEKTMDVLDPFKMVQTLPDGVSRDQGPIWACAMGLALREAA